MLSIRCSRSSVSRTFPVLLGVLVGSAVAVLFTIGKLEYDSARIALNTTVIAALGVILSLNIFRPNLDVTVSILFCLCVAAVLYGSFTESPDAYGEAVFLSDLSYLTAALVSFVIYRSAKWRAKILLFSLSIVMVFTIAYAFVALLYYSLAMLAQSVEARSNLLPWGFANIRYWSHLATWMLPLMPLFVLHVVPPLPKIVRRVFLVQIYLSAAVWWWLLFFSMARGSVIGIISGFLLTILVLGVNPTALYKKIFLNMLSLGVLLWFLLELVLPFLVGEVSLRGVNLSSSGRLILWREAFYLLQQSPLRGAGPLAWQMHDGITDAYFGGRVGHPHNMYLLWAIEYGSTFLLLIGVLVFGFLWKCRLRLKYVRNPHGKSSAAVFGLAVSVFAASVHAFVSAVFLSPYSIAIALVLIPLFFAYLEAHSSPRQSQNTRGIGSISQLRTIAIVPLILWFYMSYTHFHTLNQYYAAMAYDRYCLLQSGNLNSLWPRFWLHGDFPRPQSMACDESKIPPEARP